MDSMGMYTQGLVVAHQTGRPGYVYYVVQHGPDAEDGYAVWGINQYGEREGIAGAQTLAQAMEEMARDVARLRAEYGVGDGPGGPVALEGGGQMMAEHPGFLDGLVEASLAEAVAVSARSKRAARVRALEGLMDGECVVEAGADPDDCDCDICDQ